MVCRGGRVRRRHATCGMCRVCHGPEELRHQMLRPANVVSECLAMDTRLISVEVLAPQVRLVGYAHVCSLRGICLRLSRGVAFASAGGNSGIPGCHQCGAPRVTSGGRGPCMMAAFTASRHFVATLGAPRPRRSVSTNSLLEDRVRAQHLMRGYAPTRRSEATNSAAVPMVKELRKRETF